MRPSSRSRGCCATASCPTQTEYDEWVHDITYHTYVHENIKTFLQGFRYDAHPMSMLCSAVAALSSFYPEAKNIHEPESRNISIVRLLAKLPTLAAFCYRHVKGLPFIYPDNDLSYVENFLSMVARMSESKYEGNPVFVKALEVLFILHADHEQNCSTNAVRAVGSSHVDPFSAIAAGVAALYGPLHGGANEQVLRMINEIGHPKNVPAFIDEVKGGKGSRLMGFGHRVYKSYDPRAKIVKKLADEVFAQIGMDKDLEIALELERIALSDDYFVSRKLYPNVDFYTGLIYRSMAFPTDFFTVLFAVARTAGWLAQWEEMLQRQGAEDRASAADLRRLRRASVHQQARRAVSECEEERVEEGRAQEVVSVLSTDSSPNRLGGSRAGRCPPRDRVAMLPILPGSIAGGSRSGHRPALSLYASTLLRDYSSRSVCIGSTDDARRAGNQHAATVAPSNTSVTVANVATSSG